MEVNCQGNKIEMNLVHPHAPVEKTQTCLPHQLFISTVVLFVCDLHLNELTFASNLHIKFIIGSIIY